jgi:hypothetical protein
MIHLTFLTNPSKKNPVYDNALKKAFFELKYIRFKFIINLFDLILVSSFYKYILWSLKKVFQFKFIERNLSLEITILLQIIFHLENRFKTFFLRSNNNFESKILRVVFML